MGLIEDMLKGKMGDLQGMLPQPREIESYKVVSVKNLSDLNSQSAELIQQGYEPIGKLQIENNTHYDVVIYVKEFIKYKYKPQS
jgi:hypothetical protein